MPASLPLPDDDAGARGSATPPLPRLSAADAAAEAPPTALPRPKPRPASRTTPRTKAAPKKTGRTPRKTTTPVDPGAPPPPPPAVPAAVAAARFAETATVEEPVVEELAVVEEETPAVEEVDTAADTETPEPETDTPEPAVEPEASDDALPALLSELELHEALDDALDETHDDDALDDAARTDAREAVAALADAATIDADADAAGAALRLRGVTKSFGQTRAVDGIDLTVPVGTFYGIVGPNGAGKTTTLSMIAGLLRPDEGTIEVAGIDLAGASAKAKRQMGILPDRLRTFDRLTGRQLLHYYGVLRGLRSSVVESRTADLARAFDLTDALGRSVSDYSTGMTKKIMLAGAMIHSPRVLVLDEPFESVDPVSSAVILDILAAYVDHGGTVVLSSHGMELVERVCSGVAVIVAGQVLAQGAVDEVRGDLTLEQRFIELTGGIGDVEGLEWLHTFSD
ncbi:ABC transporter ATP-binding protein [Microbacterium lacticum]